MKITWIKDDFLKIIGNWTKFLLVIYLIWVTGHIFGAMSGILLAFLFIFLCVK